MIHINSVRINGFKAINALSLEPKGGHVQIEGANGKGKSSLIDAIWIALTGQDVPTVPVHRESIKAAIEVGLTDGHTVTRTFTPSGSKLSIEGPDGQKITTSPQKFLDGLVGRISFDPFSFSEQTPAKQKAFLTDLLGLDFSDLDQKKAGLLERKRETTSEIKACDRQIDELAACMPVEPVDVAELSKQKAERDAAIEAVRVAHSKESEISTKLGQLDTRIDAQTKVCEGIEAQILKLRTDLEAAEQIKSSLIANRATGEDAHGKAILDSNAAEAAVDALPDVSAQIANASATNLKAADWARKQKLVARHKELTGQQQGIEIELAKTETERIERLTDAKFPVKGLAFSDVGVTYNGLPFDKQSQCMSDILKVGVAIAVAQNPGVRIARIKDGSLLDQESMAKLLKMLENYDFQAFIEVVSSGELKAIVLDEEA